MAGILGVFVIHKRIMKNVALLLLRTSCVRACVRARLAPSDVISEIIPSQKCPINVFK
jgi:hypothetical protein